MDFFTIYILEKLWKYFASNKLTNLHIYTPLIKLLIIYISLNCVVKSNKSEKICSYKELCTDVHSSIICNSPKVEITQMSINGHKQNVVYQYSGILFRHKKEWSIHTCNTWINPKNIIPSERNQTKRAIIWFHLYEMSRVGNIYAEYIMRNTGLEEA